MLNMHDQETCLGEYIRILKKKKKKATETRNVELWVWKRIRFSHWALSPGEVTSLNFGLW